MTATDSAGRELSALGGCTVAGRYDLLEFLGSGVFGGVFRARHRMLGTPIRSVAVKVSRSGGLTEEAARGLFADALLLAKAMEEMTDAAARAHLVHIYDGGIAAEIGDRAYLVMELVTGTTLAAEFASYRRLPASLLLGWTRQVCVALAGLHALRPPLLHRDLKPDNVLIGADRTVRLVDFGLAARLVQADHVAGTVGTLGYMAPETLRGESVQASDVYSLGVLLYEGLTGAHPFRDLVPPAGLPGALHCDWLYDAKRHFRLRPPGQQNPTVPAGLEAVVLRCLDYDPRRRYRDAAELRTALDDLSSPVGMPPLEQARRLRADGDLAAARQVIEQVLGTAERAEAFALLVELGDLLADSDPAAAAGYLARAWELTGPGALLRTRAERQELLLRCEDAYQRLGNTYQANRFRDLRRRETGPG